MTANEPMSTPDSGGLRAVLGLAEHEVALRDLWRDLAEKNIEMGTDWPFIARTLYRDIDRLLAAHPEPVPTPDSADDATVGEREVTFVCAHIYPDGMRCRLGAQAHAMPGMSHHEPATPPADDANRAPVSGGLDEGERAALAKVLRRTGFFATHTDRWTDEAWQVGLWEDLATAVLASDWLAARDAAWVERLAAVEGERDDWKATAWGNADLVAGLVARAESAEAERDTARREAGERIAQAIEAECRDKPRGYIPCMCCRDAALIARADALTSDVGSGA